MSRQIAIYGRGGVGASTVAANISAALADDGLRVVQVGCDPRHDSCGNLHTALSIPTVMDLLRKRQPLKLEELIIEGYKGVACIELGDPFIRGECASQAIAQALGALVELDLEGRLNPDLIIYDIPWEAGCTGFAAPLKTALVQQVFVVISPDFMSFYTANGILKTLVANGGASMPLGFIANGLSNPFEESFVADFARTLQTKIATVIPRSLVVRQCELYGKTVIEAAALSNQASTFRRLARQIAGGDASGSFVPLAPEELKRWARNWGDLIFEMENGLISDGAAI
jgi:nitrogenase iron protein NifH